MTRNPTLFPGTPLPGKSCLFLPGNRALWVPAAPAGSASLAGKSLPAPSGPEALSGATSRPQGPESSPATDLHQFAESLGNAIDAKDPSTARHSEEVAEVARRLAIGLGLSPDQAEDMHVAGHLHDIGKIGIPGHILRKRGPLNAEEWAAIRRHPEIGADILRPVRALDRAGIPDMALHHHERFDGSGYPRGLTGPDIPLGARIIAVADSLSAMLQHRTYRPALSFEEACAEIQAGAGTQFDPEVVEAFWRGRADIRELMARLDRGARIRETGTAGT